MKKLHFRLISSSAFLFPAIYAFYLNAPVVYSFSYLVTGIGMIVENQDKYNIYLKLMNSMMTRWCFFLYFWRGRKVLNHPMFFFSSFFSILMIYQFHLNNKELQKMDCIASIYYFLAKYVLIMFSNIMSLKYFSF